MKIPSSPFFRSEYFVNVVCVRCFLHILKYYICFFTWFSMYQALDHTVGVLMSLRQRLVPGKIFHDLRTWIINTRRTSLSTHGNSLREKKEEKSSDVRDYKNNKFSLVRLSSIVKASRLQSTEDPSLRIWFVIFPPYSFFHCQTRCQCPIT